MDTTRRFPRSMAEAFASERYAAIEGPYRRDRPLWLWHAVTWGSFAGIGVLLALGV